MTAQAKAAALIAGLDGPTLRELAAIADQLKRPTIVDPERAAEELAEMLEAGTRPTIGWWRRHARTSALT